MNFLRLSETGLTTLYGMDFTARSKLSMKGEKTMNNDLISRKAAIAFLQSIPYIKEHPNMGELMKEWIEQIPSVQPKTGRWIDDNCSECRQYVYHGDANNYCPNCGAKMESEE